jgi:N-acetylneuraminic acid mutarotase
MMLGFLSPRGAVAAGRAWARGLLLVGFGLLCLAIEPAQAAQFVDAAPLPAPRSSLAAVLMPSGKVFAIGGAAGTSRATTQMYDPAANVWTPAASMVFARNALTATVLPNGKVLAAAGFGAGALKSAELYDPAAGTWTRTGDLATARSLHTATLLPSGKVLVAGGYDLGHVSSAELYDPATNAWSSAGTLNIARDWHTAALLPSGKVLIAGGFGTGGSGSVPLSSAEIYDPATNTWTLASPMSIARAVFTATPLPSGKVLVTGGDTNPLTAASAEVFDPASGTWTPVSSMSHMRAYHSATLLPSGHVLVAAGINLGTWVLDAEIYDPVSNVWHAAGTMSTPRQFHAAVGLPSGKVLFVGGNNAGGAIASVELYDPTTTTSITSVVPDVTEVGAESVVSFEVNAEFGTPTGSVVVTDDAGASCGPVVLVAGSGSCTLVATSPGGHSIAAVYTPDDDAFATSTGFSGYVVLAATTTIEIISDTPDPSELFQSYDVSVHVSVVPPAAGMPTGIVSVVASDDPFPCPAMLDEAGNATCTMFAQSAGDIELVASYEGSSDYEPSQSTPEMHTV